MDLMTTTRRDSARERILDAALELFFERGIQAVGVDAIVERAGVAKMSLYNHFDSKDELIAEFLREKDRRWRAEFAGAVNDAAPDGRGRILAAFDIVRRALEACDYRGCAFINAAGELADASHPGRAACAEHIEWLRSFFESLARDAHVREPAALAGPLVTLFQGALTVGSTERHPRAAIDARHAAEALLRSVEMTRSA